jgi:hypothetical protein
MNQNHVIESWIAELALDARTSRAASLPQATAGRGHFASRPVGRRIAALLDRPRPNGASLRPCIPTA